MINLNYPLINITERNHKGILPGYTIEIRKFISFIFIYLLFLATVLKNIYKKKFNLCVIMLSSKLGFEENFSKILRQG